MAAAFREVPGSELLVRLSLTAPPLIVALTAPFAGVVLDAWGRRPVIVISLIIYGLAGTAGLLLGSLHAILASRVVFGLGVAGVMSGFTTLFADYFSGEQLSRYLGYQGAAIGAGGMVFLLVGGLLAGLNWRLPFLIHLLALVLVPAVLITLPEPQRAPGRDATSSAADKRLSIPTLGLIYASAFAGMLLLFVNPVQLPFRLEALDVPAGMVGLALSLNTLASVAVALFYRQVKAKLSFQSIYAIVFLALAVNHLVTAAADSYWVVVIGLVVGGLGLGLMPPNISMWVATVAPEHVRGRSIGGMAAALFLGQFASPLLAQPLLSTGNVLRIFWVAAAASGALTVFFVLAAVIARSLASGRRRADH
jgi:MFS family permease